MSLLVVALTNLAMWTRDQVFPDDYERATWTRLQAFFRLPGWVQRTDTDCYVFLRAFNDTAMNRDLAQLCETVNTRALLLPDGLRLHLALSERPPPVISITPPP